jgi:hypothetical protein
MTEDLMLAVPVTVSVVPLMLQLVPEVPVCPELLMVRVCPTSRLGTARISKRSRGKSRKHDFTDIAMIFFRARDFIFMIISVSIRKFSIRISVTFDSKCAPLHAGTELLPYGIQV